MRAVEKAILIQTNLGLKRWNLRGVRQRQLAERFIRLDEVGDLASLVAALHFLDHPVAADHVPSSVRSLNIEYFPL